MHHLTLRLSTINIFSRICRSLPSNFLLVVLISVGLVSCSKYLDVQPYDSIGEDDLFSTESGFQKLLNGVYIDLNDDNLYGKALTVEMVEVMANDCEVGTNTDTWGEYINLYNHEYTSDYWRGRFDNVWDKAYSLVMNCNKILDNIEDHRSLFSDKHYRMIKGEALALRAYLHFDMLRMFGPVYKNDSTAIAVPYRLHQSLSADDALPANEVMQYVINDLNEAHTLLADIDPILTDGLQMSSDASGNNFERYRSLRMNYYAVEALLARVWQYRSNGEDDMAAREAYAYASGVIERSSNLFPFVDKSLVLGSPTNPDRVFSSEVLFGLTNNQRGQLFKENYDPSLLPNPVFCPDSVIFNEYMFGNVSPSLTYGGSKDDYRYVSQWKTVGSKAYFYKYQDITNSGLIYNTIVPMLRMGEMYLICAECAPTESERYDYLNQLRTHRGISAVSSRLESTVKYEFIRELFGEGQIFFYHKRNYMNILRTLDSSGSAVRVSASNKVYVVPLPDTEANY